jgi:hypothetical protein
VAEMGQAVEKAQFFLCKLLIKKGLTVATNLLSHALEVVNVVNKYEKSSTRFFIRSEFGGRAGFRAERG